ncbi:MAG: hypothetical protein ACYTBJ_00650 [Planctomycetota bacterium]|jgi:hypothetical protein
MIGKTVWVVLAEEDGSFISVCANEDDATTRALSYEAEFGNVCEVFEETIEDGQGRPKWRDV